MKKYTNKTKSNLNSFELMIKNFRWKKKKRENFYELGFLRVKREKRSTKDQKFQKFRKQNGKTDYKKEDKLQSFSICWEFNRN